MPLRLHLQPHGLAPALRQKAATTVASSTQLQWPLHTRVLCAVGFAIVRTAALAAVGTFVHQLGDIKAASRPKVHTIGRNASRRHRACATRLYVDFAIASVLIELNDALVGPAVFERSGVGIGRCSKRVIHAAVDGDVAHLAVGERAFRTEVHPHLAGSSTKKRQAGALAS